MPRIMSDNDVRGHVTRLMDICQSSYWAELWRDLECLLCTFQDFELSADATDATIWQTCQDHEVVLIIGNRNADDPESLESTIRQRNTMGRLPVLTLADPDRIGHDGQYAQLLVEELCIHRVSLFGERPGSVAGDRGD